MLPSPAMALKLPSPAEILAAREAAGLTQAAAGELVHVGVRTWQKWEYGERDMDGATWELFLIKTKQQQLARHTKD